MEKSKAIKTFTKVISAFLVLSMLLSIAGCAKEEKSKYSLQAIQLAADERSWINPEEKYADLLPLYSKKKSKGTLVVATDEDVLF